MRVAFKQVDVFTKVPYLGNPVAVVLQAEGLSSEQMQRVANWTNLSETTFVLPPTQPGADYRVRIFTPKSELPFAGHPTVGTAFALLEAGRIRARDGKLVQECAAGLVNLNVSHDSEQASVISFTPPEPKIRALTSAETEELAQQLRAELSPDSAPSLVELGPRWVVAQLQSAEAVLAVAPDFARMAAEHARHRHTGVVIFGAQRPGVGSAIEIRAFAPADGIPEDPVCGSGTASVAAVIRQSGQTGRFGNSFVAAQGQVVGRAGFLRVDLTDALRVGGNAVTCIEGVITLPES